MSSRRTLKGKASAEQTDETTTRTVRRPTFSTSFRLNLFLIRKGLCAVCSQKIDAGKAWDIDHIVPLALGGTNAADNLQILCRPCHRSKTTQSDVPRIAKTKRLKARHLGAHAPSIRPIPGSRSSPWKRKMDGSVVRRKIRLI
ncbi:MAG: HNH endonuclease [Hyphomicrobiales bacterium]|nr:HNH endonuclease [Hyphomicrobiales bacterium]